MIIILWICYYFISGFLGRLWKLLPKPKLEMKQQIKIDQSLVDIFLGEGIQTAEIV